METKESKLAFIYNLERCGFEIWGGSARCRMNDPKYNPKEDFLRLSDLSCGMIKNNDYSWWKR